MPWFHDNVETLLHSGPRSDPRVKKVLGALSRSDFGAAMKASEDFLDLDTEVQSTAHDPRLRDWLVLAASFSRTAVIMLAHTGPWPPPKPVAPDVKAET